MDFANQPLPPSATCPSGRRAITMTEGDLFKNEIFDIRDIKTFEILAV